MKKYLDQYRIPSARLQGYDYRQEGMYFLTICTDLKQHFFGKISDGHMHLSEIGKCADTYWQEIPKHFPHVDLGSYVIMPNHVHGIVIIQSLDNDPLRDQTLHETKTLHATSLQAAISPKPGSIATIVRSYKSAVTKQARAIHSDFGWQTRYHDHIIRNNESFHHISEYIINNPLKWEGDTFYR